MTSNDNSVFTKMSPSCQIPGLNDIYEKYYPGKVDGTFIDVGAYDGYTWSNTWGLAEIGWRGLCFEPIAERVQSCIQLHKDHNVFVVQTCVGSEEGTTILHTGMGPATINAETVRTAAFGYGYDDKDILVSPLCTLNSALVRYNIEPEFELISIDVEGAELEVLDGFDLAFWKPKMVILETCKNHPDPKFRFHSQAIEDRMLKAGYVEIYFDHINSIYVRHDHPQYHRAS